MFNHVLVPLDFRFVPKVTLMTAAVLAAGQGAELTLLYVSDIAVDFPSAAVTAITDDVVRQHRDNIRRSFDNALAIISEYGSTASTCVVHGIPVHKMIKKAAATLKADVIVMGSHGRRGLAHVLHGSVRGRPKRSRRAGPCDSRIADHDIRTHLVERGAC